MMIQRSPQRAEVRAGFTLMEMLVVVAIIVLLAAMAVPLVMGRLEEAKISRAKVDAKTIAEACEMYQLKYGNLPNTLEELTMPGADGSKPFLETKHLLDPWSRQYQYLVNGPHNVVSGKPDVWSAGPNGNMQYGNW
jgi:general secretion pathway protein G